MDTIYALILDLCLITIITSQTFLPSAAIQEAHAAASRKESSLMLELQMATAKQSYAVACAVERGTPNGEVEEGIEVYETAKKKYMGFLHEQTINHLHD